MGEDNSKKSVYGLLGRNINYSLSPSMHNSAFTHFGLCAEYKVFDIEPEELKNFLNDLVEMKIKGFNITVPYKVDALRIISQDKDNPVDDMARKIGAVNTVKSDSGCLKCFNTDGHGFIESLKDDLGIEPEDIHGKDILIIGAGGASRAVSFCLMDPHFSPSRVFIHDVDPVKTEMLTSDLNSILGGDIASPLDEAQLVDKAGSCVLVVNATPLGTRENDPLPFPVDKLLSQSGALYDLVYSRPTPLVAAWKQKGLPACGGLGMLVNQAALAFNIWTGNRFGLIEVKDVMRGALPQKMKGQYQWNIS